MNIILSYWIGWHSYAKDMHYAGDAERIGDAYNIGLLDREVRGCSYFQWMLVNARTSETI